MEGDEESNPVFTVKDDLCKSCGITAEWINGSKFSVCAFNPIGSTIRLTPTHFEDKYPVNIFHLDTELIFEEPILRTLISEANTIFISMQKDVQKNGTRSDYVRISRSYRSIIRACLEKLQDAIAEEENTNAIKYESYVTIFYSVECVWHLCEILLIDPSPSNIVVQQLLDWIRFHFPSSERLAAELLIFGKEANIRDDFWPVVKGMIFQGQIDVVRTLLQLHSSSNTSEFKDVDEILKSMPIYNAYGGLSIHKFRSQWQYWISDTQLKLSSGIMVHEPNLEELIKIITGDKIVWNEHIKKSSCWYEYFPGYLFFTEPACKFIDLDVKLNKWIERWVDVKGLRTSNFMKHLDRVIFNLMENNMNKVLHSLENMCDNKWFVTHLTDLLYTSGNLIISDQHNDVTSQFRDGLLFEFGSSLMSRGSFWIFGIDYIEFCTTEAFDAMEILLSRIPVSNEKEAFKVIDIAKRKGLHAIEREVCRIQVKKSVANNRYGSALEWAIRSKDIASVTSICDYFLSEYSNTGEMPCGDIISNIGGKMFVSPRLVFLVKFYDFKLLYQKNELFEATELLVNLLDSKITPKFFWPTLLMDAVPLLEYELMTVQLKETYIILHHLESTLLPLCEKQQRMIEKGKSAKLIKDYRVENIKDISYMVRIACARNLARAIVKEYTS